MEDFDLTSLIMKDKYDYIELNNMNILFSLPYCYFPRIIERYFGATETRCK
jgi:hypothetical protein